MLASLLDLLCNLYRCYETLHFLRAFLFILGIELSICIFSHLKLPFMNYLTFAHFFSTKFFLGGGGDSLGFFFFFFFFFWEIIYTVLVSGVQCDNSVFVCIVTWPPQYVQLTSPLILIIIACGTFFCNSILLFCLSCAHCHVFSSSFFFSFFFFYI